MRISDWSSDVCSSDLAVRFFRRRRNAGDNKLDPMTAFGIDNEHLPVQVEKRVEVRIAILAHGFSLSDCDKKDKPSCVPLGFRRSSKTSPNQRSNTSITAPVTGMNADPKLTFFTVRLHPGRLDRTVEIGRAHV